MPRITEDELDAIDEIFATRADVETYIMNNHMILLNSDFEKHDMSKYKYVPTQSTLQQIGGNVNKGTSTVTRSAHSKMPPYIYTVKINTKLVPYMPSVLDEKENLYVYTFGKFQYGSNITTDGRVLTHSGEYDLLGIIKPDENGKLKTYHALMYPANAEPEFYRNIVFSDMVLRNAVKNNFGFIGTIQPMGKVTSGGYASRLIFDGINDTDLVNALSFAMQMPGRINAKSLTNLSDVYKFIDEILGQALEKDQNSEQNKNAIQKKSISEVNKGWTQGEE